MKKYINLLYIIQKLLQEGSLKEIDKGIDKYRNVLELHDTDLLLLLGTWRKDKTLKYINKKLIKLERENIYDYLENDKFKKLGRAFKSLNYKKEFNLLKTINNKNKEKVKEKITKKLKIRKFKKITIKIVLFFSIMILLIYSGLYLLYSLQIFMAVLFFAILFSPFLFPEYVFSNTDLSYLEWIKEWMESQGSLSYFEWLSQFEWLPF